MPWLDVSDLTLDPDLADSFTVTRRQETYNHGRVSTTNTEYDNVIGVVTMASPNDLQYLPEEQHTNKVISVITQFRLQASAKRGANSYQPDLITWHGSQYVVIMVEDYAGFGQGQIQAFAASIDRQDPAPPGSPP